MAMTQQTSLAHNAFAAASTHVSQDLLVMKKKKMHNTKVSLMIMISAAKTLIPRTVVAGCI